MRFFRSQDMEFYSLVVSNDYAWDVMNELGDLGALQFTDLNEKGSNLGRQYINHIKRCEEMESKILSLEKEIERFNVAYHKCYQPEEFLQNLKQLLIQRKKFERTYFEEVEQELDERIPSLHKQIQNYETLVEKYNHHIEYKQVLLKTRPFILDKMSR